MERLALMLQLLRRLKPLQGNAKVGEAVARLAAKDREARSLVLLTEYLSALEDKDVARVWPRLVTAIYSSQIPDHRHPHDRPGPASGKHRAGR